MIGSALAWIKSYLSGCYQIVYKWGIINKDATIMYSPTGLSSWA